jgi:hypothetical protein
MLGINACAPRPQISSRSVGVDAVGLRIGKWGLVFISLCQAAAFCFGVSADSRSDVPRGQGVLEYPFRAYLLRSRAGSTNKIRQRVGVFRHFVAAPSDIIIGTHQ